MEERSGAAPATGMRLFARRMFEAPRQFVPHLAFHESGQMGLVLAEKPFDGPAIMLDEFS